MLVRTIEIAGIPPIFRIFRLKARIPPECKTWIEVCLSLSFQAEFRLSGEKSGENRRNSCDLNGAYQHCNLPVLCILICKLTLEQIR
jgi:hypothetical protein